MNHSMNANNNIKCSVSSCTHHNSAKSVCSLSSIQVGCCGPATRSAPAPSALPTRCPSRRAACKLPCPQKTPGWSVTIPVF